MTLLESVVAFIVLALVGLACLDLSRGASQLQRSSAEWTQAVARGEAMLAQAQAGVTVEAGASAATVTTRVWRDNVELLEVIVPLSQGGEFRLSRLVRRRSAQGPRVAAALSGSALPMIGAPR